MLIVVITPFGFLTGALVLIGAGIYIGYVARDAQVREAQQ